MAKEKKYKIIQVRHLLICISVFTAVLYYSGPPAASLARQSKKTIEVEVQIDRRLAKRAVLSALKEWDKVSEINFKIVKRGGDLKISLKDLEGSVVGRFKGWPRKSGDIWIDATYSRSEIYYFNLMLHEVGHFLGLEHNRNGNSCMFYAMSEETAREYGKELSNYDKRLLEFYEGK